MKELVKKVLKLIPNAIKNFLYGDLSEAIKDIKSELTNNEKDNLRYKVLSFASSLRRGEKHTTQEFETIFHFHDKYEKIIAERNETNGYLHEEFEYIKNEYKKRCELI